MTSFSVFRLFPPYTHIHHHHSPLSLSYSKTPFSRRARAALTTTTTDETNNKIVVVMGPTGCGKTKLSVDLASTFFPSSEIINSDKIQVYTGLDITTNKIPLSQRNNVPHRLLGDFVPTHWHPEFTPSDYRSSASLAISQILSQGNLPFIVGGSNSFIYALLAKEFNPELDVFSDYSNSTLFCKELRYRCCFIWVHISPPVLNDYLEKRVDDMLESGMLDELAAYFADPESDSVSQSGLKKAIGVPEFEKYFKGNYWGADADVEKRRAYQEAVRAIKDNTCHLAKRQLGKILRLRDAAGWDINRVDATTSLIAKMGSANEATAADIWKAQVVDPTSKIVNRFLME